MAPLMAGPSSGAGDPSGGPAPVDQASVSRQDRLSARSLNACRFQGDFVVGQIFAYLSSMLSTEFGK
ncbi:MAG: hypothetical protein AVDCRST_MAG03-1928 [uncultured Rubrobacteraceae bacterium]|uniref:Uncharacterized protein n=1 Tax=uncultured Rubrobacteraceae bacterium TaxID=349277 RepID=A0A6J4PJD4_9ACTN|nr:MAG: hypothetical protein AVDCRST_MAG03-1928 [uncultured Rubrobacteraceae bacterium]